MKKNLPLFLLIMVLIALAGLFYQPYDQLTCFLETVPVMIEKAGASQSRLLLSPLKDSRK